MPVARAYLRIMNTTQTTPLAAATLAELAPATIRRFNLAIQLALDVDDDFAACFSGHPWAPNTLRFKYEDGDHGFTIQVCGANEYRLDSWYGCGLGTPASFAEVLDMLVREIQDDWD